MLPGGSKTAKEHPQNLLQGTVERVTYHDSESLYSVLKLAPERGYDDPRSDRLMGLAQATAVGPLESPFAGQRLRLHGTWGSHPSHGRQFEFDGAEMLKPLGADGVVRYLASPAFPGIGEVLARRIVAALGAGAIQLIREEPDRLGEVKGLTHKVRERLVAEVNAEFVHHELHSFLREIGLGPRQAAAVVRRLGPDCRELLRADPYLLAGAAPGIGFGIADRIAANMGLAPDAPERCRAAVLHVLQTAAGEGHSFLPEERLVGRAGELLGGTAPDERLAAAVDALEELERVATDGGVTGGTDEGRAVYLPWLAASERGLAANVARLSMEGEQRADVGGGGGAADAERLALAERDTGLELDRGQREAVLGILRHPLSLLTGGPGVGKTTIVRLVVALAEADGARVRLASPTGRAAKRLAEATGRPAATIHRLLGFRPAGGGFAHGARNTLEADLVVVDEISMLDVVLAHHLFKAIAPTTRVLLVGDPDQLPSVAPGNVLAELIASERVPVFRLSHVHRQEQDSLIVANAHRILRGLEPELPGSGDTRADFYFFPADDEVRAAERLVEVVTRRVPRRFDLDWVRDVQVLAPMYKGECGVDALNERLREELGSRGGELRLGDRVWREGDRVIHTRNDYEREIFNGDMGRVSQAGDDGLRVAFPEREVEYGRDQLADLRAAFAITVHRSQGSEYPAVVVPLTTRHRIMLQRNLLYTAVTRARRLLVLVGSRRALRMALENAEQSARLSALGERLRAESGPPPSQAPRREDGPGLCS